VASSKDRERKLARAKIERQKARRAARARAQRQLQARIAAAVVILLVVVGVGLSTHWYGLTSPKPVAATQCVWTPADTANNKNLKDVGEPATSGLPESGVETMTLNTNQGQITTQLDVTDAPCTAASFSYLAGKHFFDNTKCHRLTTSGIYVLQCGDPSGTGSGGPSYTIEDENIPVTDPQTQPSDAPSDGSTAQTVTYKAGTVAVANTGSPNSGSSQFFLVYKDSPLPASYAVMGTITGGMDVITKIAKGGVASGGSSSTDGPPKTATTIQTLTVGKVGQPDPEAVRLGQVLTRPRNRRDRVTAR
jgi:peptidyl-prolyl cis-trans isomerase B (cyclophilin B)